MVENPRPRAHLWLLVLSWAACPAPEAATETIGFFRADPMEIYVGQSVELAWEATNASQCILTPDVGSVGPTGVRSVSPVQTTTYELSCNRAKSQLTVTVRPPLSIMNFRAMPTQTVADGPVELSWSTEGASICDLDRNEVPVSGTQTVLPSQTTTYTLRCWIKFTSAAARPKPDAVAQATVTIVPATTLEVPTNVVATAQDGMLKLTWVQGAGSAVVYFAESGGIEVGNIESKPGWAVFRRVVSPFIISGLVNGKTYFLRIAAVSGATSSALSNEVSAQPQGPTGGRDPYFAEQWHLVNPNGEDIRVEPAWAAGPRGEGVKVIVVDEGVDEDHEDLRQNMLTGASHDYLGNAPVRLAEHGTCVAGLLAARDLNSVGLRGVAPRAGLMSFNLLQDFTSANEYDAMVRHKEVAHISNNSWGDAPDNTGLLTEADPLWLRGVTEGATRGRAGKGVVYFWSSGNGGDPTQGGLDDSNFDSQANSRFVLAIGGVGRDGKKPAYAEGGANVLVAAPTEGNDEIGLVTTDITGADGYNSGTESNEHPDTDYSSTMNGTSASAPLAAGVGALILQVRPELSYRDVRRVLALSARKNDPSSPGWSVNGAGLHIHHAYGFGVVDANAAVLLARSIVPVSGEQLFETPLISPRAPIPDDDLGGMTSSTSVSGTGLSRVEIVEVEVSIAHGRTGDLEIFLEKAGGALDLLHPHHSCVDPETGRPVSCSDIDGYVFTSVRHLDEPADGQWTLSVKDRRQGTTGTLVSWRLRLYGRP